MKKLKAESRLILVRERSEGTATFLLLGEYDNAFRPTIRLIVTCSKLSNRGYGTHVCKTCPRDSVTRHVGVRVEVVGSCSAIYLSPSIITHSYVREA